MKIKANEYVTMQKLVTKLESLDSLYRGWGELEVLALQKELEKHGPDYDVLRKYVKEFRANHSVMCGIAQSIIDEIKIIQSRV